MAILLASGGNELCQAVMGNRAMNGHVQELSVILYYMAHQCVKEDGENASIATPRLRYIYILCYSISNSVLEFASLLYTLASSLQVLHIYSLP